MSLDTSRLNGFIELRSNKMAICSDSSSNYRIVGTAYINGTRVGWREMGIRGSIADARTAADAIIASGRDADMQTMTYPPGVSVTTQYPSLPQDS
jgi:hypothetical protein